MGASRGNKVESMELVPGNAGAGALRKQPSRRLRWFLRSRCYFRFSRVILGVRRGCREWMDVYVMRLS